MVAQAQAQSRPNAARFQEILRGLAQAAGEDLASARDAFIRNYLAAGGRGGPLAEGQTDAEQRAAAGLSLAGLAGGGGMAVGRAAPGRGEAIGMFLGRRAKHPLAGALAKWREGDPLPPGAVMGPEGRPRIEISDVGAKPASSIYSSETDEVILPNRPASFNEVLQHESLLRAYPDLAKISFYPSDLKREGPPSALPIGQYYAPVIDPSTGMRRPEEIPIRNRMSEGDFLRTILHELQHAIQYREGFPKGTSVDAEMASIREPLSELRNAFRSPSGLLPENIRSVDNFARDMGRLRYARNLGEQEARAVSDRRLMSQDELARTPPVYLPAADPEVIAKIGREIDRLLKSSKRE
jgi:hypothetical protein